MASNDKELWMNKFEYLNEIRYRMLDMERMRLSINEELDLVNVEERCLQEYRREMDSLYQEKMTHVEELRQIHSDINMLENVLKQSEEDRNRHVDNLKRMHHQLQQLKDGVEKMRAELGMSRLPDSAGGKDPDAQLLEKLDLDKRPSYLKTDFEMKAAAANSANLDPMVAKQLSTGGSSSASKPFADNTNTNGLQASGMPGQTAPAPPGTFSSSLASLMSGFQDKHHQASSANQSQPGFNRLLMSTAGSGAGSFQDGGGGVNPGTGSPAAAAFRQQPPPMKSCLSCHQQIHRNAPICPLCKAKSRSRHPKRRNQPKT